MKINYTSELVGRFDDILGRGLCSGIGKPDGQMCIEAAVCAALGLPHGDDPECVEESLRSFKIRLNDSRWSSASARARGMRDVGLAQIGSKGVIDGSEFARRIAEKTIRVVIPKLFRQLKFKGFEEVADRCEKEGTREAANAAADAARAAYRATEAAGRAAYYAANAAARAAYNAADAAAKAAYNAAEAAAKAAYYVAIADSHAAANAAADAADAAYYAARANAAANATDAAARAAYYAARAAAGDEYLEMSAKLALEVLVEMGSPGVRLLAIGTRG